MRGLQPVAGQHVRTPGTVERCSAVTLVLRIIRQNRWDSPRKLDWLAKGDIPADPMADFANTSDNSLSVWLVENDNQDLDRVVAALAAGREKADKLDYMLFTQDHLAAVEAEIRTTNGNTLDEYVNGLHRDLPELSAAKVLALTRRVWDENLGPKRVDRRTVIRLVADAVRCKQIKLEKLRPKLREDVMRFLENEDSQPLKPR